MRFSFSNGLCVKTLFSLPLTIRVSQIQTLSEPVTLPRAGQSSVLHSEGRSCGWSSLPPPAGPEQSSEAVTRGTGSPRSYASEPGLTGAGMLVDLLPAAAVLNFTGCLS